MSQIYLATQSGIGGFRKLVVLKTILPDIGGEEDFVRMFLEEARTTAAFNHPNIAQVYELDVDSGELFMAMEFVQGCTLVEMAKACRAAKEPIPIGFTLQSVRDTALALHYAHSFTDARGRKQIVIHRDVAEKNIMVTYEGVTKLLDFGIAKALGRSSRTSIGMVKGTSGYMSPEQIRGEPLDARSDIFSLGVVLHECLTGLRLFHGRSPEEGMMAALNTNVAPPSKTNPQVSPEVDAVVMKALQRKREDRFGTALEFARAIDKAAPGLIWHPEQTGELVSRHFADRRQETRRLLEATNFGGETTGELRIDSLMARVKSAEPRSSSPTLPPIAQGTLLPAPTPPTGLPNSLRRKTTPPPPPAPSQAPQPLPEPETNPARPKVLRANSSPDNQTPNVMPMVVRLDPGSNYDDDDSEAKTIPAAALPDEIKALRAKLSQAKPLQPTQPMTDAVPAYQPSVVVAPEPSRPIASNIVKTIPAGSLAERTSTGETLSITTRGAPSQWSDEEPEAKTAIGLPFESMRQPPRRSIPSGVTEPAPSKSKNTQVDEEDDDFRETVAAATRSSSTVLVAAILVPLFIAAVLAVLYAAGLPPFERESPLPTKNNVEAPKPAPAPEG
ncbi:MAG: serine/threonine protein kinase [Archangiaceae bacterium]|nr:serine/threonine protein kinase [Archangiaceae bacterium]